ncbi:MAG: serine/threonine protein kinase [Bacteroidetes bacterium]|nr:serine/threonine protein kinase [Bacteroidota bacterium]
MNNYDLPVGTLLNQDCYRINKRIGKGGFGITYLAEEIGFIKNTGLGAEYVSIKEPDFVVIKELYYEEYCQRNSQTGLVAISNKSRAIEFEKLVENQLNEGRKLKTLNHDNIVKTRDIFKENDTAYMVMDYVDGLSLEELLKKTKAGRLEKDKVFKYISQILSALVHIHERNKLHLDIKPTNILIHRSTDNAVLIDFGIAQSYDQNGKIIGSTSQLVIGQSPHYAPNEQSDIDNLKDFDATFDTYAVGATLYHILTGNKPPLSSLLSTGRKKLIPPSETINDENITDYTDAILIKALAPLYHERFRSAEEFKTALSKENEYQQHIRQINDLLVKKEYGQALSKIAETEKNFLPTPTLYRLKLNILPNVANPPHVSDDKKNTGDDDKTRKVPPLKKPSGKPPIKGENKKRTILIIAILSGILFLGMIVGIGTSENVNLAADTSVVTNIVENDTLVPADEITKVDSIPSIETKQLAVKPQQIPESAVPRTTYDTVIKTGDDGSEYMYVYGNENISEKQKKTDALLEKQRKATDLVAEGNYLFSKKKKYDEAFSKYVEANKLVPNSAEQGYKNFLKLANDEYSIIDPCDKGYIDMLKKAQELKNTSEVRKLLKACP